MSRLYPTTTSDAGDVRAIIEILPHQFPLLLVDRVIECVPGKHIVGLKNVTQSESSLARHVGGQRAMPHLLVIEALAQLSVILAFRTLSLQPGGDELMFFVGIDSAKFHRAVRPGQQLLLRSEVTKIRKLMGWFQARAEADGCSIVEVAMLAAMKPSRGRSYVDGGVAIAQYS